MSNVAFQLNGRHGRKAQKVQIIHKRQHQQATRVIGGIHKRENRNLHTGRRSLIRRVLPHDRKKVQTKYRNKCARRTVRQQTVK